MPRAGQALALMRLDRAKVATRHVLTQAALRNAMVLHAAFGGSTNLLLHLPAVAHAAKLRRPTAQDWAELNRQVPRLVDCLPNGPRGFATVQVFLAGAVPEVMLHLRDRGLLDTSVKTVSGDTLDTCLDWWKDSSRRRTLRRELQALDGIDPQDVIMTPDQAKARGLTATVTFPVGNLAPDGSVVKSTSIDASLVGADNVYRKRGPARVFISEHAAIQCHQEQADCRWRRAGSDLRGTAGIRHAGDLSDHLGAEVSAFRQAHRGHYGCALQPASLRGLVSVMCHRRHWPAVLSASSGTAT